MAITPIDATSVLVEYYSDLKTVLENTGSTYTAITTVYLKNNITLTGGINLHPARASITIDGNYPDGTTKTIADVYLGDTSQTIGVRTAGSSLAVTFRNLVWEGNNNSGAFYAPATAGYQNVSVSFENIVYTGPKFVEHPTGVTKIIDSNIFMVKTTSHPIREAVSTCKLELGGVTWFRNMSSGNTNPIFFFHSTAPNLKVLTGADVRIETSAHVLSRDVTSSTSLTIEDGASLSVSAGAGFCQDASHALEKISVDSDASLRIIQTSPNGTIDTIYCNENFYVGYGGSVYMEANYEGAAHLINFGDDTTLDIINPKSFVLYNVSNSAIAGAGRVTFTLYQQQINYWNSVTPFAEAGGMDDTPAYSWRKTDGSLAFVLGHFTAASTTVDVSEFTPEELIGKPLSLLQLQSVRQFSAGSLPLGVNPITMASNPVTGTTAPNAALRVSYGAQTFSGTADAAGAISVDAGQIPAETEVTTTANIPFLLTSVMTRSPDAGELTLLEVPDLMPFILSVIATEPVVLYGREDAAWSLTVSDSRFQSGTWYIYATINGPLTSQVNPEHTVPGAVVYVSESDTVTELSDQPVLVFTGEGNGGQTKITDVSWDTTKGVLLQATSAPYFNGEPYRADLTWTLSEEVIGG